MSRMSVASNLARNSRSFSASRGYRGDARSARALRASHLYLLLAEKERELRAKLDATDILLITRYTLDRAEPGSALGEAARRVRAIGERAADNLGVTPHPHGPGLLR